MMLGNLLGRYRIEHCLGRGGMGEVYLAHDQQLDRRVAIKSVFARQQLPADRRQLLLSEARAAAAIDHPAVAKIFDVFSIGEQYFLVLEYVDGQPLSELLERGPFAPGRAIELAVEIAAGLQAAHQAGIVHRDLKTRNVMVTRAGRAKILDFGLALVAGTDSPDGDSGASSGSGMAGTLSAMSPEQVSKGPIDQRSDLFSLGTLLYEVATGSHPFQNPLPPITLSNILTVDPPPPHEVNAQVPEKLSTLIMSLLAKDPSKRPPHAAAVIQELRPGYSVTAQTQPSGPRWPRLCLVAITIVALAAVAWQGLRSDPDPTPIVVAICQPEVANQSGPDDSLVRMAGAIRQALGDVVSSYSGVSLAGFAEVDRGRGDPRQVSRMVAADQVLTLSLRRAAGTLLIVVTCSDGNTGYTDWVSAFELPVADLQLIRDTIAAHLHQYYGHRGRAHRPPVGESGRS